MHHAILPAPPLAHSIIDAARLLGIGRTRLYQLIDAGDLPTIRIGSRRLIRDQDLRDFLDRRMRKEAA